MDNRKEMYAFAKRALNRKFKQEIEAKWLITRTLSTLKEKTDDLVREFFENPRTKTACAVAEAARELRKQQKSEGGRADQSGVDSRKEGERVAEAEDAMEVDGTGPSGVPKAAAPKDKAPTTPKRRDVEHHEGRKVVREQGGVQSKPRGPRRSPTVDEEVMKVVKKEEFDALIRPRIETLDEAMRRRMEKGKGKATDLAASGAGKATDEITVRKMVAPKKRATAKSKSMVGSETDEAGEGGRPVAGPSKPSSDEGEEFLEPSDDDEESESGKRRNPRRQAKPRKGSMALPKIEIVERNMRGMTRLPSLGPTNGEFEPGCRQYEVEEVEDTYRDRRADTDITVEQRDGGVEERFDIDEIIEELEKEEARHAHGGEEDLDGADEEDEGKAGLPEAPIDHPIAPSMDPDQNPYVLFVHTNGLHSLPYIQCGCGGPQERIAGAVRMRLMPASFTIFKTMFTFDVLEDFRLANLE
ncbi:hypothetical protein BDN71DRAFT_1593020, partial [Pleurotus eryngii]